MRVKWMLSGAVMAIAAAAAAPVSAGTLDWSFDISLSDGDTAVGTLVTDSTAVGGYYLVTSLSGTIGGNAMVLLAPDGVFNDNEFSPTQPTFDETGLGFTADGVEWAFYSSTGATFDSWCNNSVSGNDHECVLSGELLDPSGTVVFSSVSPANSDVPEPASLAILGVGLLGLAALRRGAKASMITPG